MPSCTVGNIGLSLKFDTKGRESAIFYSNASRIEINVLKLNKVVISSSNIKKFPYCELNLH